MSSSRTYPSPPVELPLRLDGDPKPAPDCDVCQALDRQRSLAHAQRDMSKVSDFNVEIRNHPHTSRGRRS
ncbi:hypothetical protein AQJ67_25785 [Streptomyces caeruleatus]|uniref:Uncharacterized protein n=1 Tax=Streptomyces caeruleatus TaxID=661399 RepID=A0A124I8E4_9ACTN|nr:hypothetical protein [Streptomyces caeruleatus]KUN99134.1 hypothetical protein AQJ67_25785 [Streptomyces caeruleatus]